MLVQWIIIVPFWLGKRHFSLREEGSMLRLDLNLLAGGLDQFAELHARRAGSFAGATAQAAVHMLDKFWSNGHASIGYCLHLIDAPARRVHLYAQNGIGWTGWQAKTTVNALAHQVVGMGMAT